MLFSNRVCAAVVAAALVLAGPALAQTDGKRVHYPRHVHAGKAAVHRTCHPLSSRLLKGHGLCFASARVRTVMLRAGWAAKVSFITGRTQLLSSTGTSTDTDPKVEPGAEGHPPTGP